MIILNSIKNAFILMAVYDLMIAQLPLLMYVALWLCVT